MNYDQVVQSRKESFSSLHNITQVKWCSDHPRTNHIHESVIISASTFDLNVIEFIPVNRIVGRAAVIILYLILTMVKTT